MAFDKFLLHIFNIVCKSTVREDVLAQLPFNFKRKQMFAFYGSRLWKTIITIIIANSFHTTGQFSLRNTLAQFVNASLLYKNNGSFLHQFTVQRCTFQSQYTLKLKRAICRDLLWNWYTATFNVTFQTFLTYRFYFLFFSFIFLYYCC